MAVLIMWNRFDVLKCKYRKKGSLRMIKTAIVSIFQLSIIFNIPRMMQLELVQNRRIGPMVINQTPLGNSTVFKIIYNNVAYYTVFYIAPIGLLVFYAYKISKILSNLNSMNSVLPEENRVKEKEITKSLFLVVIVFIVTHLLAQIHRILLFFTNVQNNSGCGGILYYINPLLVLGAITNSTLNIFIYSCCMKEFKQTLRRKLGISSNVVQASN